MDIPIVTLDRIYIEPDEENIYFLDCTRVNGSKDLISRGKEEFVDQILRISKSVKSNKIVLAENLSNGKSNDSCEYEIKRKSQNWWKERKNSVE